MVLTLLRSRASDLDSDAVVVLQWEGSSKPELETPLAALYSSGEITGKLLEFTLVHGVAGYKARRILVAGAGKRDKFDAVSLRRIAGAAVRFLKGKGTSAVAFALDDGIGSPEFVAAIAEGASLGAWEPDYLKTDKEGKDKPIGSIAIAVGNAEASLDAAFEKGRAVAEAANLSR